MPFPSRRWIARIALIFAWVVCAFVMVNTAAADFLCATLNLLAYGAGPALAFILLFVSPASVSVINLASSLVFAAMVPFVAISKALVYFDLTVREGRSS